MKVIVTDGSYLQTLAITRYLGKQACEVYVISSIRHAVSFRSRYCQKGLIAPRPAQEVAYIEFLHQLVANDTFDLLIPVGYQSTLAIVRNSKYLSRFVKTELADFDRMKVASDKRKTYELAEKIGVPYPRTSYPQTFEEAEKLSQDLEYPLVIKQIFEGVRKKVEYAFNSEQFMRKYYAMCQQDSLEQGNLPMVQEYVHGDVVYSFAALYQNGQCKRIFMFKEIRSIPVKGGSASYAESFYDQRLKEYGLRLLDELNWHGVSHVEFKQEHNTGALKLMEINPKFWASLDVALQAGMNFPYYLCEIASGKELAYSEEYNRGVKFHFPLSRELQHIEENPKSIPQFIIACLDPNVKSNVWLSDFKPNIIEFVTTVLKLVIALIPKRIRSQLKLILKMSTG
jgi:predicted ATP-grasp superfamily ATP-dependent carboligase